MKIKKIEIGYNNIIKLPEYHPTPAILSLLFFPSLPLFPSLSFLKICWWVTSIARQLSGNHFPELKPYRIKTRSSSLTFKSPPTPTQQQWTATTLKHRSPLHHSLHPTHLAFPSPPVVKWLHLPLPLPTLFSPLPPLHLVTTSHREAQASTEKY